MLCKYNYIIVNANTLAILGSMFVSLELFTVWKMYEWHGKWPLMSVFEFSIAQRLQKDFCRPFFILKMKGRCTLLLLRGRFSIACGAVKSSLKDLCFLLLLMHYFL